MIGDQCPNRFVLEHEKRAAQGLVGQGAQDNGQHHPIGLAHWSDLGVCRLTAEFTGSRFRESRI